MKKYLFFLIIVSLVGCSSKNSSDTSPKPPEPTPPKKVSTVSSTDPYELELKKELNDGELLSLVLKITPHPQEGEASPLPDKLWVELLLYGDGEELFHRKQSINELVSVESLKSVGDLPLEEALAGDLLLQAEIPEGGTDYQVRLVWDSWLESSEKEAQEIIRSFSVERGEEICEGEVCGSPFDLLIEVYNPFPATISGLSVDTWYASHDVEDHASKVRVALEGIVLDTKERRKLSIELPEPLPKELMDKGYRPFVEIAEFEFLGSGG